MGRGTGSLFPDRTPFVGRERELVSLRESLDRGARLLTITGPSGMGKTRIARQLARGFLPSQPGGVRFLGVGACRAPADLRAALAQELGLAQQRGAALSDALAGLGPLLVVLDNVDPGAAALAAVIGDWLDRCPELVILVTSLMPLGIRGEVRFELGPLDEGDAVALYLDRAREAWSDRAFTSTDHQAIGELVQRLDGLPLAIELAAARVRVLTPRQLLERISQRLELLRSDDPGRHGSLVRALSLSWNLLTDGEQQALARASVFVGGFTLDTAEPILGHDGLVDRLDGLRAKALLQLDGNRFSLYESVREFAALRLRELGWEAELQRLHAQHFASHGELQAERSNGPDALEAMRWLAAERENLLAAYRRSFAAWPAVAAQVGLALSMLLTQGGPASHEKEILDGMVQVARRAGEPSLLARTLWARARAYKRQGEGAAARQDLDEGLELARIIGDRRREGYLLVESGAIRVPGADPAAQADLEVALAIARSENEPLLEGIALLVLGALEESRGNLDGCASRLEEALAIFRSGGHLRYRGVVLLNLGGIRSHGGRFSAARQALEEARGIFDGLENLASMAYATINLGSLALAMGALDEAEEHLLQVLAIERRCGNRLLHAVATGNLGMVALERGELREGERRLAVGLAELRELGALRHRATLLPFHAAALAMLGGVDEAYVELAEARAGFEDAADDASLQMLALLEGVVELGEARLVAQGRRTGDASALEARAQARLAVLAPTPVRTVEGLFAARRLLEITLARRDEVAPAAMPMPEGALVVGKDSAWFSLAGGARVDLQRRTAIRRILRGLVENRLLAPGVGASAEELAAVGWPGEKILPGAASTRVWSGIRTLRSLGLSGVLLRHADGYLLEPDLPIVRDQEG